MHPFYDHVPLVVVSTAPCTVEPLTTGKPVFTGATVVLPAAGPQPESAAPRTIGAERHADQRQAGCRQGKWGPHAFSGDVIFAHPLPARSEMIVHERQTGFLRGSKLACHLLRRCLQLQKNGAEICRRDLSFPRQTVAAP